MRRKIVVASILMLSVLLLAAVSSVILWHPPALAAEASGPLGLPREGGIWSWGYLAAALATGLSSLGAAFAVGSVGSAAVGALTEKPELFGRLLIVIGLAEGIAIYGLIISVMILNHLAQ